MGSSNYDTGALGGSAAAPAASDRKILEVIIEEATNLNRDTQAGKDDELTDGFMKVEVRGPDGTRPVKMSTKTHILDAVPIDKYFEMFKPGSGSDGGFVRLKMRLMSNSDMKREKGQGKAKGLAMIASVALGAVALGFAVLKSKK